MFSKDRESQYWDPMDGRQDQNYQNYQNYQNSQNYGNYGNNQNDSKTNSGNSNQGYGKRMVWTYVPGYGWRYCEVRFNPEEDAN